MPPTSPHQVDPAVVIEFLQKTLPFSELDKGTLSDLAKHITIDFHPKGARMLTRGKSPVSFLYMIQKGGVKLTLQDEDGKETLLDYKGENGAFGALALIRNSQANLDVETVEDTFFFKLEGFTFLQLVKSAPVVAQYYLKTFSDGYVSKAFAELRRPRQVMADESGLYLFGTRVQELMHGPPITIDLGQTIREAAAIMVKQAVGSLLVVDPSGDHIGIVTDKDLRKSLSVGMDHEAPIEVIMSTPVATIDRRRSCFDALMRMMSRGFHHLAVTEDAKVVGVLTSHDVMVLQGRSPITLFREIAAQREPEGLHALGARIPQVVRMLIEEGAKPAHITSMITVLNDLLLERLLTLLQKKMGPPPLPFCWLLMGSEGRREQTFKTDQDNALIYKDCEDDIINRAAAYYFESFSQAAIDHLVKCGFPLCPGEIMASNPKWRMPFTKWKESFDRWMAVPEPQEVMHAAIFFDFRPGHGETSLADELREHLVRTAPRQEIFLRLLAANCLESRPPLSFFRNFIVEKNGEHKNTLDMKKRGLTPISEFARVMTLMHGIAETNTLERLEQLDTAGSVPHELCVDAKEAYGFLMQLRLVHQLEQSEMGNEPDNRIAPGALSELEKRTLKEAFGVIGRLQSFLKDHFRLNA